ncbi:MAG: MFS transporter [Raoultibacter sp.]
MKQKRPFYGWKLAVVVGMMYFCSGDAVLPTATIVNPLMLQDPDMHMTGTILGAGFSLFILMQGLPGPLIGTLIAKKGARFTMMAGSFIMIVGAIAMILFVRTPLMYFLFFGILLSVGSIMAGLLSVQSTVGNWFVVKRGMAMTLTMGIAGVGAIVVPFIANKVVEASGGAWQSGWYLIAAFGVILIPVAFFLVKNKPEDIGQSPDGAQQPLAQIQGDSTSSFVYKNTACVPHRAAIKTLPFWLIALTGTGGFFAYSLATSQGVIHFTTLGFDQTLVVGAVVSMGIASLVGRIAIGSLSDRFEPLRLMTLSLFVAAFGILLAVIASNETMVYGYYLCTGFGFGAITTTLPTAVANYFGAGEFPKNLGTTMLITTLFASCIPLISGAVFDATGFCTFAFMGSCLFVVLCALSGLFVKIPKQKL